MVACQRSVERAPVTHRVGPMLTPRRTAHAAQVEVERGKGDKERGQVVDEVGAERGDPEGERLAPGAGDPEDVVETEGGRGAEGQRAQREHERGGPHRHVLPRQPAGEDHEGGEREPGDDPGRHPQLVSHREPEEEPDDDRDTDGQRTGETG